jgi:hypothetical protein
MDGKIEQRVCIKFCVELSKSAIETLEMPLEVFGKHSLRRTAVFERYSRFKFDQVSVRDDEAQGDQAPAKGQEILKKFENSSTKTVAKQSMS